MEDKVEWVEIVEPKSGDHMFANLRTGQCLWEAPQGAKVKKTHDNQWWELYDATTRRYYYYNASSQKTVWRKPKDGDIIPLAKLQQLKAKETGKKSSVDSITKQKDGISKNDSFHKEDNDREHKTNNGNLISYSRDNDNQSEASDIESIKSDASTKDRLRRELDLAFRTASFTSDSNKFQEEESFKTRPGVPRSSSVDDSETDNFKAGNKGIDKLRSQTVKVQGVSPKIGRKPPPKPPRIGMPASSESHLGSDSELHGVSQRSSALLPGYEGKNNSEINVKPNYEGENSWNSDSEPGCEKSQESGTAVVDGSKDLDVRQKPDYDQSYGRDSTDGAMLSAMKPAGRSKSLKPNRPPPVAPPKPLSPNATKPPNHVPIPPPLPIVKAKKDGRRQLPKIDLGKENAGSDKENEGQPEEIDTIKSPFSRMIQEMEEYSGQLPISPDGHPVPKKSKGVEPSTSLDETSSPSGTLLPTKNPEKFTPLGNALERSQTYHNDGSVNDRSPGSNESFAERLTTMGMPSETAVLVDACDPSSAPGTPLVEPRLTRIHSDTTVVVRKPPSPANGEKAVITNRPMSLMPSHGKSRDAPEAASRTPFNASAPEAADLTREVPLSKHRKGFLRRRMSIASMLSWSKNPIKKPMVMTRNKQLRKEAIDVFKLTLQYMGDKGSRKSSSAIALEVVSKGWSTPGLRDEIYIQLCKQTTCNEKSTSLKKGWELITMCLSIFPPSNKFHSYLEGYIYRHLEPEMDELGVPISTYAKHCYKQLERICQSGAKRGLKRPTVEEIEQAKESVFHPSMFGNTLEDIMEMQEEHYKSRRLPWIMTTLAELVLANHGLSTEGIFRVPGDIDEVNSLKVQIDKWQAPTLVKDPHIPGSLLKLWFRDLYEPLIPNVFYEKCIRNCDDPTVALSIVYSIPELNSLVFCYLIRFLQAFMTPDVAAVSKMDENNLAMVWAPNCLRCPSDDPMQIYENTRKEMTFLRTLMKNLDTSFLEGVV
ncbi:rho GTPase-activating protein 39-like isoform X2 [Rhopilema esculentum]|uniref:rho GTPase-activating protein 39-like isoform X2 n=1 Tax=Rhopilema esculentum TaxID=499914 RepID=UPI0031D2CF87